MSDEDWTRDGHMIGLVFHRPPGGPWESRLELFCPVDAGMSFTSNGSPCHQARDPQTGQPTGAVAPGCVLHANWTEPIAEYFDGDAPDPARLLVTDPVWFIRWRPYPPDECFVWTLDTTQSAPWAPLPARERPVS